MSDLSQAFEQNRVPLRAIAQKMLGSASEAEDAVQESWLRLTRSDPGEIENLAGWLRTVLARVCLDVLRARKSRREEELDDPPPGTVEQAEPGAAPERARELADSLGLALDIVLNRLSPAERVAFVLHDSFELSFEEIAPIVRRSPVATRQLATRARRRVQGVTPVPDREVLAQRSVVDAFLAASRAGDLAALLAVLDPDVVLRPDAAAVQASAAAQGPGALRFSGELRGAQAVAGTFLGRAAAAQPALVDGAVGAVWAPGGKPRAVFAMTICVGRIAEIELFADPRHIAELELEVLTG